MANPEHVALVREGSAAVTKFLGDNPGTKLDLSGADFHGLDLRGCNLSQSNLTGADLSGADLRTTILGGADLRGATLRGADVRGTSLHQAKLQESDLRDVNVEAIGVGRQLVCAAPHSFEGAHWDKERLAEIIGILNLNRDWEIRYELVPKAQ